MDFKTPEERACSFRALPRDPQVYAEKEFSYTTTPVRKTMTDPKSKTISTTTNVTPQKRHKVDEAAQPITPRRRFFFADNDKPSFLGHVPKKW